MNRKRHILLLIITAMILFVVRESYAQPQVPIPNPEWPLDSVVNGSVHSYTVQGDQHYADSSLFVWTVSGGRLFNDPGLVTMAGNGSTAIVSGKGNNTTKLWVVWDSFDTPLDTGYVYVYEISADGCQRSVSDEGKYQGMRIKVSSPPKVHFLTDQTIACSNNDSARILLAIEGMPPFDLKYSVNGEVKNWHVKTSDLADLDGDGVVDNISFFYDGFKTLTNDVVYTFDLLEVSSGGVKGKILDNYPTHTLIAHVQPTAPHIRREWTEITAGYQYNYMLDDKGVNPIAWNWKFVGYDGKLLTETGLQSNSVFQYGFDSEAIEGTNYLFAQYSDNYGCVSLFDSMDVKLFGVPTIAFSDTTPDVINCSATSLVPDEEFRFVVEYRGANTFGFTYLIYDDMGHVVGGSEVNEPAKRSNIITIPNKFVNDSKDNKVKPWKVVITSAKTEDTRVNVNILDSDIPGGRDERVIMIYPKPLIQDDIDFAN